MLTTTFNEMADVIVKNMNNLKSSDQLRRELIANISHDLRSPITIMQGYIETVIMKDESLSKEEKNKYLDIIYASSTKLSHLVDQLFQYSKLEANEMPLQKEPFLLNELVSDITIKYEIIARQSGIELIRDFQEGLPPVFADIALVERVVHNLLDNAFKFTPEGGSITITLKHHLSEVEVSIADTGTGIPLPQQSYIFDRYKQVPESSVENKGMGLGLAIVKKILTLHNSTIDVRSILNKGTTFFFLLQVYQPSNKKIMTTSLHSFKAIV